MKIRLMFFLLVTVAIVSLNKVTAEIKRDNSLKVACMTSYELSSSEADEQWCQCENDYYADLLTDSDWEKYTHDYYALERLKSSTKSTPANSYARKVQIGNSECIRCKENQYKSCLKDDKQTPSKASYTRIFQALKEGDFANLNNTPLFQSFYVDFLHGYSAFCGNALKNYTERTIISTQWQHQNHVWWEGDTTVSKIRVDSKYMAKFEQYEKAVSIQNIGNFTKDIIESRRKNELPSIDVGGIFSSTVDSVTFMRSALNQQCSSDSVQTVNTNLLRFIENKAPVIDTTFKQEKEARLAKEKQHYSKIIAATKRSRENSIKVFAQQRKEQASKAKTKMSCDAIHKQSGKDATQMKSFRDPTGTSYESLTGGYNGKLNGHEIEIISWPGYSTGDVLPAMAYLPAFDCLMSAQFRTEKIYLDYDTAKPRTIPKAYLEFRMYSQNWRPNNCDAMVKYSKNDEIHHFTARGFLQFTPGAEQFSFFPSNTKLGAITPQNCDVVEVDFRKSKISDSFYKVLQQYSHPDKRGPQLKQSFLDKHYLH